MCAVSGIAYSQNVCVLLAWIHILSGYITLYRGEFSSPPSQDRKSSCCRDWRFLPKAQSSIVNVPPLGYLAALSPRCSGKQRFIITHDLLSSASSVSYRHSL